MFKKKLIVLFLFLEMACVAVAYTPGDVLLKKQMNGYMNDIKWYFDFRTNSLKMVSGR